MGLSYVFVCVGCESRVVGVSVWCLAWADCMPGVRRAGMG